jgi:hypothetical protein
VSVLKYPGSNNLYSNYNANIIIINSRLQSVILHEKHEILLNVVISII